MRDRIRKLFKYLAVPGAAATLVLSCTGMAHADAWTWQGYTRDSTWNCGPAGSTVDVNGLYLLPCTKHIGSSWQAILIVTGGDAAHYILDVQTESSNRNASWYSDACAGGTSGGDMWVDSGGYYDLVYAHESYACFAPTVTDPNDWVWGVFKVKVMAGANGTPVADTIVSPAVLTGT
ncbi:MAG TPA: hypothetical protein VFN97_09805 [Actinospica sp.]|nr:hypothetical protein [Actinospica sp.]